MKEIKITKNEENQRLDKYLLKYFNKAPKSFVYKMLRKKRIKLNKGKAEGSEMLLEGDTLQLYRRKKPWQDLWRKRPFLWQSVTSALFTRMTTFWW